MTSNEFTLSKRSKNFLIAGLVLLLLVIIGVFAFQVATEYIWMDSLSFGDVYTKVLYTKVALSVSGFILFFLLSLGTGYWIRNSYLSHFSASQLPPVIKQKKLAFPLIAVIAIFVGIIGSGIVQGVGWEPTLKLLNYASFDQADPHFNMDISFYVFVSCTDWGSFRIWHVSDESFCSNTYGQFFCDNRIVISWRSLFR